MRTRAHRGHGFYGRFAWAYLVGVMIAYSAVILSAKIPPAFVDYPDWVYQGVLFRGVLTGHPVPGYVLKTYPVPNSLTTVGLGLLDTFLPWQWAAKIWIVLYLALATVTIWYALRAAHIKSSKAIFALPAIIILNLNFWYGHISFEIGVCLTLLLAVMLLRGARPVWIGTILVLIFFTHMEACAAALLLLVLWCGFSRRWAMLWAALPSVGLTVWYGVARFASGNADARSVPTADYAYASKAFLIYKVNTFAKTFGYINAQSSDGLSLSEHMLGRSLFVAMIVASVALSGLCLYVIFNAALKNKERPEFKIFGVLALTLMGISTVLPQIFLGVADPGSRLILMASAIGMLLIDWRSRAGAAIAFLSVAFCLVNLWQFAKIERTPRMIGHPADLPTSLMQYGHVQPATRLEYYDKLERGQMDEPIFSTAMFLTTSR